MTIVGVGGRADNGAGAGAVAGAGAGIWSRSRFSAMAILMRSNSSRRCSGVNAGAVGTLAAMGAADAAAVAGGGGGRADIDSAVDDVDAVSFSFGWRVIDSRGCSITMVAGR